VVGAAWATPLVGAVVSLSWWTTWYPSLMAERGSTEPTCRRCAVRAMTPRARRTSLVVASVGGGGSRRDAAFQDLPRTVGFAVPAFPTRSPGLAYRGAVRCTFRQVPDGGAMMTADG
jgi:hypothetical protein